MTVFYIVYAGWNDLSCCKCYIVYISTPVICITDHLYIISIDRFSERKTAYSYVIRNFVPSYLSPVSPKGERLFACLRKGLIDNELRDNYKGLYSFDKISQYLLRTVIRNFVPRTFKRLTNQSSPL